MMTSLPDDRSEILARIDLVATAEHLGLGTHHHNQWRCPDPTHAQTGATPPASITAHGPDGYGVWHCHGCGAGGSVLDMLALAKGLSVAEAFAVARQLAGMPEMAPRPPADLAAITTPAHDPDDDRVDDPEALAGYLAGRGWSPEVAERYGLHAVRGRWGYTRIRHPYRSGGHVQWWQDRSIHEADTGPKWHSPRGMSRVAYALDLARVPERPDPVWIVEGPADAITLAHVLPGDAAIVGLPGTSGVGKWAHLWAGRPTIVATDADPAGDACAHEIQTAHGRGYVRLRPPTGLDLTDWRATRPSWEAWSLTLGVALDSTEEVAP